MGISGTLAERFLPQICSFERSQNPFRRLIQPGHEFRFIDNVPTEGAMAALGLSWVPGSRGRRPEVDIITPYRKLSHPPEPGPIPRTQLMLRVLLCSEFGCFSSLEP